MVGTRFAAELRFFLCAAIISLFLWTATVSQVQAAVPDVEEVRAGIRRQAETLARIRTLYVKIEISQTIGDGEPQKLSVSESWRAGVREREYFRHYASSASNGFAKSKSSDGTVEISSCSDRGTRRLRGWDPQNPLQLPLDPSLDMSAFASVQGEIAIRDPRGFSSADWIRLMMQFPDGSTLTEATSAGEIVPLAATIPGGVRFKFVSSSVDLLSGTIIELDARYGYMIRIVEWKEGDWGVNRVEDFGEFADDVWLPTLQRNTYKSSTTIVKLIDATVNVPMADDVFSLDFPEGARVDDSQGDRGAIHIWGKSGPSETFASEAEFMAWVKKRMQKGRLGTGVPGVKSPLWQNPWIWANAALVLILAILLYIRRAYLRKIT